MADIDVPSIDFGTWHGYPLYYRLTVRQFDETIAEFCRIGARAGKPVLLEEFGYARSNADAPAAYATWLATIARDPDCAGWLVWRLVARQDGGRWPVDEHDRFDVRNDGGPIWTALREAARAGRNVDRTPGPDASAPTTSKADEGAAPNNRP